MDIQQAKSILGNRSDWEIKNMKKALTSLSGFFNDEADNERLETIETLENNK